MISTDHCFPWDRTRVSNGCWADTLSTYTTATLLDVFRPFNTVPSESSNQDLGASLLRCTPYLQWYTMRLTFVSSLVAQDNCMYKDLFPLTQSLVFRRMCVPESKVPGVYKICFPKHSDLIYDKIFCINNK